MMTFNPGFNPAQLLSGSAPSTPVKEEMNQDAAAIRYLAANGPLFNGFGAFGAGAAPHADALRAMVQNGGVPLPFMFQQNELKPEMLPGGGVLPSFFLDPMATGFHPYAALDGQRRKNATRETTAPLKQWLGEHRKNPYPTKAEKLMLAFMTKMTLTQVSTWFANARRRLKKENKMTWSPRNRPGEDDDDDLADNDVTEADRPSSCASSNEAKEGDELKKDGDSENNNHSNKSSSSPSPSAESPRKSKIWSIADTLSAAARKKEEEVAAASTSNDASTPQTPPQLPFPFPPWAQQQMALAALQRSLPSFPMRPELMAAMQQAARGVPGTNPAFLFPLGMLGMFGPQLPVSSASTSPTANGGGIFADQQPSPASSSHSSEDNGKEKEKSSKKELKEKEEESS